MSIKRVPRQLSEQQKKMRATTQFNAMMKGYPKLSIFITDAALFIYRAGMVTPEFRFDRRNGLYYNDDSGTKATVKEAVHWANNKLGG